MLSTFLILDIAAYPSAVFDAVSTPAGLDTWWTRTSAGVAQEGEIFELRFSQGFEWRARVSRCDQPKEFELSIAEASEDWLGSRIHFLVVPTDPGTRLRFQHINPNWNAVHEQRGIASYCWATYLRLLKGNLERGERVSYEERNC